ncbi:uncharacterized protein LOC143646791 isoform X4 [Tamandua tetradactyla]|uniref:uncharacterized protein LOC143646791 isoform X4 n=1 Tax=Tamandua tetradactyla TaxID=48850 RepID=UPI004054201B
MHSPPSILGLGCWQNSRSAASGAQKPASSSPPGSGLPQVGHILYSGTVLYQHEEISEIMKYCTEENKIFTEKLSDFKKKITKQKDHIDEVNKLKISLSEEMNTFKDYKQTLNLINKTMGYMINWMQVPMELEGGQNVKDQDSATSTLILQYHLRGLASNNCSLEEYIKKLQEDCEALQSENRALEEESKMLTMNIPKLKRTYNERKKLPGSMAPHQTPAFCLSVPWPLQQGCCMWCRRLSQFIGRNQKEQSARRMLDAETNGRKT